ncbi:hypothetical protein Btru_012794 [Bulinus truncatus]|nr:hypothetical protein Btru_012794 [Bulinus truncatus]
MVRNIGPTGSQLDGWQHGSDQINTWMYRHSGCIVTVDVSPQWIATVDVSPQWMYRQWMYRHSGYYFCMGASQHKGESARAEVTADSNESDVTDGAGLGKDKKISKARGKLGAAAALARGAAPGGNKDDDFGQREESDVPSMPKIDETVNFRGNSTGSVIRTLRLFQRRNPV